MKWLKVTVHDIVHLSEHPHFSPDPPAHNTKKKRTGHNSLVKRAQQWFADITTCSDPFYRLPPCGWTSPAYCPAGHLSTCSVKRAPPQFPIGDRIRDVPPPPQGKTNRAACNRLPRHQRHDPQKKKSWNNLMDFFNSLMSAV